MRTLRAHVVPLAALLALATTTASPPDLRHPGEDAPTLLRCGATPAAPVQRQIGPGGGSIELSSGHNLDIPARSLASTHGLEMAELRGDSVGVRIRGGRSPVSFRRFAVLTLSYDRCPDGMAIPSSVIVVRVDPGGVLTPFPSQHNPEDRSVTTILSGNSEYLLAVP
jgi:hypothetical protein